MRVPRRQSIAPEIVRTSRWIKPPERDTIVVVAGKCVRVERGYEQRRRSKSEQLQTCDSSPVGWTDFGSVLNFPDLLPNFLALSCSSHRLRDCRSREQSQHQNKKLKHPNSIQTVARLPLPVCALGRSGVEIVSA